MMKIRVLKTTRCTIHQVHENTFSEKTRIRFEENDIILSHTGGTQKNTEKSLGKRQGKELSV